jgi:hypothetical protein
MWKKASISCNIFVSYTRIFQRTSKKFSPFNTLLILSKMTMDALMRFATKVKCLHEVKEGKEVK